MAAKRAGTDSLGFKQLSLENWTEVDPVNRNFGRLSPLAGPVPMEEDDWAREFLAVELSEDVPCSIRDLFNIARGAMLYGWFFYPLFRLAEEQLYRVLEAAAMLRCQELSGSKRPSTYAQAIDFLSKSGLIPTDQVERWSAARRLRNMASHPERATVVPPGFALRMLSGASSDIDSLFGGQA